MKNKNYQRKKAAAKRAYREAVNDSRWDHERGIKVYHVYDEEIKPRDKTYWDDVSFVWRRNYVVVCWIHPRYEYTETIDEQAYEAVNRLFPAHHDNDWLLYGTKNFKKVGKSRKKVVSYTTTPCTGKDFYDTWREFKHTFCNTSTLQVRPHIKVEQTDYSLMVNICCPIEVRNEDNLKELADIVRSILDQKTTLKELYGDYAYTAEDYKKEFPKGEY